MTSKENFVHLVLLTKSFEQLFRETFLKKYVENIVCTRCHVRFGLKFFYCLHVCVNLHDYVNKITRRSLEELEVYSCLYDYYIVDPLQIFFSLVNVAIFLMRRNL